MTETTSNDQPADSPEPEVVADPGEDAAVAAVEPAETVDAETTETTGSDAASEDESAEISEAPVYTQSDLDEAVAEALAEQEDRRLRVLAEYDNFRRRTARERSQWLTDALAGFVKDLLPVVDSLDKAAAMSADDAAALSEGLTLIRKQLAGVLDQYQIKTHDPEGEPFDPRFHEALTRQPSADHAEGTVLTVFEKGFTLQERLLRAARVVVATKPQDAS